MRGLAEFITHVVAKVTANFDGDVDLGLVFVTLLRRADLDGDGSGAIAPTSINAISRASNRPFETVRRLCNRLCDLGLVEKAAGPSVTERALADPRIMDIRAALHDNLVRLVVDLARLDYPMPATQAGIYEPAAIERAAMDLLLYSLEFGIPPQPIQNWQRPLLYIAVMTANARAYTFDPLRARLYADITTPPPDAMRTPIAASALARAVALPYSTVRRNLEDMVEIGQLVRVEDGYLINMAWMQSTASAAAGISMIVQLERVLRGLAAIGFPLNAAETAYRHGPPEFLDFL